MTSEQCKRLLAATKELEVAEANVRAICAEIAAGDGPTDVRKVIGAGAGKGTGGRGRRGGARKPKPTTETRGRKEPQGDEKVTYHPEEVVGCARCGEKVKGAKRKGVTPYPYKHSDPKTGEPCVGAKSPAKILAEG